MEPEPDTHALTHAGPKYKPRKGEKNTHFCRWDDDAVGGRWYECVIDGETTYADERGVLVKCLLHDGSVKECPKTEVCPIETVQDGDDCLAYWSGGVFGRAYCFAGKVTEVSEAKEQYLLFWASEPEGTPKWETKVYSHRTIQARRPCDSSTVVRPCTWHHLGLWIGFWKRVRTHTAPTIRARDL